MDWEAFYNRFREPNFIAGYEIQNRLGGGAFGEVYKARKHSIGKAYAIKFLKIDDDEQRDAVERELEQVRHFAAIDHPNLVTIEDMGTALGVPYLIMGYAGEDTLARRLKQGPLEPSAALSYFVQACRAVVALHDRRLVHFDLKPSNVFLKGDVARVGDYGLSKMMAEGRSTLSFGRGTPHYMAPEMLRNRADHRADIYSLGVILFESFARKLPFESAVPGTIAVREDDRPPQFPPGFPAGLRPVVERCLRLAPEDRYPDVTELLSDMGQTARPGDSVRLREDSAQDRVADRGAATDAARKPSSNRPVASGSTPATQRSDAHPSEARTAARELTRGAVEVARGVWDGLRSPPSTRSPGGQDAPAPERSVELRDVMSMNVLSSSGQDVALALPHAASLPIANRHTIPVPPRVEGGWYGTLISTLALSLEVLLTLGRGLSKWAAALVVSGGGWAGAAGRGVSRRSGSLLARGARLLAFLLLLFVLGGLTTLAAYYVLRGAS